MNRIYEAAQAEGLDVYAFVLVMRYSGLRLGDTATLRVDALKDDNTLALYMQKTGEFVSVQLPEAVAAWLREVQPVSPNYFFWSGRSKKASRAGDWWRKLNKVFKRAGIANGHPHRFRDSFAAGLFLAGTSIDDVAALLGHQNTAITRKHYSPWIKERQDRLNAVVKKANGFHHIQPPGEQGKLAQFPVKKVG